MLDFIVDLVLADKSGLCIATILLTNYYLGWVVGYSSKEGNQKEENNE